MSLISLISDLPVLPDLSFFFCWYLKLEKLRILATGGLAVGATKTRSLPCCLARFKASCLVMMPAC